MALQDAKSKDDGLHSDNRHPLAETKDQIDCPAA
jgi:hypothetical protein